MHLASRYATLLELHVARLRDSFVVSSRPPRIPSRATSAERNGTTGTMDFLNNHAGQSALAGLAGDVTAFRSCNGAFRAGQSAELSEL
jgi:hypothetical protein